MSWIARGFGGVKAKEVRQFCTALDMTHEQREAASGVPHGRIASIDSGTAEDVHASIVIGFAKGLHVRADYLLYLKEQEDGEQQRETTAIKTVGPS